MKILILGGMHGNEPLGIGLVNKLIKYPIPGVEAVLINNTAVVNNKRFIITDIQTLFPGDPNSRDYESKRAAEIIELCKKYELVLDFHNTNCPNNDCSFVGESTKDITAAVSSFLGLKRTVVVDYNCLNKYAPNCISIEISINSKRNNYDMWYRRIIMLSKAKSFKSKYIKKYRYIYDMTLKDRDRLKLLDKDLKPFRKLSKSLAKKLGVKSPAYPILINDKFTPDNFGGILNKM